MQCVFSHRDAADEVGTIIVLSCRPGWFCRSLNAALLPHSESFSHYARVPRSDIVLPISQLRPFSNEAYELSMYAYAI